MAERKSRESRTTYGNLAYNLDSLARERQLDDAGLMTNPEAQPAQAPQVQRRVAPAAKPKFAVSPLLICSVVAFILSVVVLMIGYTKLAEVTIASSELRAQLEELNEEHVSLLTKYEQTFDLASVKEIAEANGMQKPTNGQIEYVDLSGNDTVTVYQASGNGMWNNVRDNVSLGAQSVLEFFR